MKRVRHSYRLEDGTPVEPLTVFASRSFRCVYEMIERRQTFSSSVGGETRYYREVVSEAYRDLCLDVWVSRDRNARLIAADGNSVLVETSKTEALQQKQLEEKELAEEKKEYAARGKSKRKANSLSLPVSFGVA